MGVTGRRWELVLWLVTLELGYIGWVVLTGQVPILMGGAPDRFLPTLGLAPALTLPFLSPLLVRVLLRGTPLLLVPYLAMLRALPGIDPVRARRLVLGAVAVFAVTLTLQSRFITTDAYLYLLHGQQQTRYHENPYLVPASSLSSTGNPLIPYFPVGDWGLTDLLTYGPVHTVCFALLTGLAGPSPEVQVVLLRVLSTAIFLLGVGLLDRAVKGRPYSLAVYACNPLVLIELVGECHNDVLMILFVLLAAWAQLRERWACMGLGFALGLFVKTPVAFLMLSDGLDWLRAGQRKAIAWTAVAVAGVTGVGCLLYGTACLSYVSNSLLIMRQYFCQSLYMVVLWALLHAGAPESIDPILRKLLSIAFLVWFVWASWRRPRTFPAMIHTCVDAYFLLFLFVTPYIWPHYLCLAVALAGVSPGARLEPALLLYSGTLLIIQTWFVWQPASTPAVMGLLAIVHLPPALMAIWLLLKRPAPASA